MKEILKNKKILYIFITLIIIAGIIVTCVFRLNFTLMNSNHTRIDINIGKEYNEEDINKIAKEVFGNEKIAIQKVETFNDSLAINVKNANDEQVENLKTKIKEKYQIEDDKNIIQTVQVPNLRGRDMIKPYILPISIATGIILVYAAIMYRKLGIIKVIFELLAKTIIAQLFYLSIIAIFRIPIGIYIMPISIGIYILVITYTIVKYQNKVEKIKLEENTQKH